MEDLGRGGVGHKNVVGGGESKYVYWVNTIPEDSPLLY